VDVVSFIFSLLVFFFALAVFANKFRRTRLISFALKPNCLLTRWPVVFVTGPRSLFYFSHYWNLYPVYLAEHGYEVFTVHMPWNETEARRAHFRKFLEVHAGKRYHFVVDTVTFQELRDLLWGHPVAHTVTELKNTGAESSVHNSQVHSVEMLDGGKPGWLLGLSFKIHKALMGRSELANLNTLAALPATAIDNSRLLLNRMQEIAELDFQEDAPLGR
jgi:hypothetical protein